MRTYFYAILVIDGRGCYRILSEAEFFCPATQVASWDLDLSSSLLKILPT